MIDSNGDAHASDGKYTPRHRKDDEGVSLVVSDDVLYRDTLVGRVLVGKLSGTALSVTEAFLTSVEEDPTPELVASWQADLADLARTDRDDPIRSLTGYERRQLGTLLATVGGRIRAAHQINLDTWQPGEDVDDDALIIDELVRAGVARVDLERYEPGENVDDDDRVIGVLRAHREKLQP